MIINKTGDRYCTNCYEREKNKIGGCLDNGNFVKFPFSGKIISGWNGLKNYRYIKSMPWIFELRNILPTEVFKENRNLVQKIFGTKHMNDKFWNTAALTNNFNEILGKENVKGSWFCNPSQKKGTLYMNGSLNYDKNVEFFENGCIATEDMKKVSLQYRSCKLSESLLDEKFGTKFVQVTEAIMKVLRENTNLPVAKINSKFAHELVANINEGSESTKDLGMGKNLPILILFHHLIQGKKNLNVLQNGSITFDCYENSVYVMVGPGAEQMYISDVMKQSGNKCDVVWCILSKFTIPNTFLVS